MVLAATHRTFNITQLSKKARYIKEIIMTIKEARLAKNLTQQALSEYLGISKEISKIGKPAKGSVLSGVKSL